MRKSDKPQQGKKKEDGENENEGVVRKIREVRRERCKSGEIYHPSIPLCFSKAGKQKLGKALLVAF